MRSVRRVVWLVGVVGLFLALPAQAGVTVDVDAATLNDLVAAATLQEATVAITDQRNITVHLEEIEVTELDPAAGNIRTTAKIRIPEIGLALTVEPRVKLAVVKGEQEPLLELRFEKLEIPVPLAGKINIARLLPPLRYPADNLWILSGARGDMLVRSRLSKVSMGAKAISLDFEIDVRPREEAP